MLDKVLVEGALEDLPNRKRIWIEEKHPQNLEEMSDLAQSYRTYHGAEQNEVESSKRDRPIKQYGLKTDDRDAKSQNKSGYRDLSKITCLKCGNKGHYAKLQRRVLPHSRAKAEVESISQERDSEWQTLQFCKEGSIKKDRKRTVGNVGKAIEHSLADVELSVEGRKFKVEALVNDRLNIPVLLGEDLPLEELIGRSERSTRRCALIHRQKTRWTVVLRWKKVPRELSHDDEKSETERAKTSGREGSGQNSS